MADNLDNLFNNNNPPSEATILKVKELLTLTLKELLNIDSEIQCLERHLEDLKAKRNDVQATVTKYSSIVSLVRQIPSDILQEIFERCLTTHRNPTMRASEAPVLLTRVCSRWRYTALSSPRLWAQLHIPFSDEYRNSEEYFSRGISYSKERVIEVLKLRYSVIKDWLGRSGTCPLSISISFSATFWTPDPLEYEEPDSPENLTLQLFRILLFHSQHWQNIELIMPLEIYRTLESLVSADSLSMLTGLKASVYQHVSRGSDTIPGPLTWVMAPNLKRLSIVTGAPTLLRFPGIQNVWGRLTYFCSHSPFSIADTVNLLKISINLVHCKVLIADRPMESQDVDLQESISLPHLQSLCVVEDSMNPPQMRNLYGCIDAPRLAWIDYQKPFYDERAMSNLTPSPILSLLRKSTKLRKLTMNPYGLSPWNFNRVLQIISDHNVTHLVLGAEPSGPSRLMSHRTFIPGQDLDFSQLYSSGSSGKEVILPRLQIFEATFGANMSDEILLQFIISRMDPFSPNSVAPLKSVRVIFSRPRQKNCNVDIAEEVMRRAEHVGIKLKLELLYTVTPNLHAGLQPLSSSYGLTEDDQSWDYDDIYEETLPKI